MGLLEPHGRDRRRNGRVPVKARDDAFPVRVERSRDTLLLDDARSEREGKVMGVLAGIARHGRPRGPIELLESVRVTVEAGLAGDFRGAVKPGARARRQVSLIERIDWEAAMADLGV